MFKKAFLVLAVSATAISAAAAPPPMPKITGPDKLEPKQVGFYLAEDVAPEMALIFWPESYLRTGPPYFLPLVSMMQADEPGEYQIRAMAIWIVSSPSGPRPAAVPLTKTVLVEGEIDPPPPDPEGPYQVAFFHQADTRDNLPTEQLAILSGLTFRQELIKRGHGFVGLFDPDEARPNRPLPADVKPFFDAIDADPATPGIQPKPLPRMAIAPKEGGKVVTFPLPQNAAAFWRLLKGE